MISVPRTHAVILALLVLACAVGGARNYNSLLNSDQYSYLCFARALAAGSLYQEFAPYSLFADRVPPGTTINLHYGTRNYRDGRVFSGIPTGFPLLLAAAIRLGGVPAVFAVNVLLLLLFIPVYYLSVREILENEEGRNEIALFSAALLLAIDGLIIPRYSAVLMRDISSIVFFWAGTYCLLRSRRGPPPVTVGLLFLAVSMLAFSCTIRLTNAVSVLPLLLYAFLFFRIRLVNRARGALIVLGVALLFLLFFSPEMIENYHFNKNPLAPLRHLLLFSPSTGKSLFSLDYFSRHFPSNLALLAQVFTVPGLLLALFGLVLLRRRLVAWSLLVAIPVLHLILFSLFEEDYHRYMIPLYPYLVVLLAVGAAGLLVRLEKIFPVRFPARLRLRVFSVVSACFVLGALAMGSVRSDHFGWRAVEVLRREVEGQVPPGSVVWGSRYLVQNVDFYTHAYSIDPRQLSGPFGLSMAEAAWRIIRGGVPLFIFDNKGVKSASRYVQDLSRDFDLREVKRWRSADLKLDIRGYSENTFLVLYRILPWSETTAELDLATPERKDYLVLIDLKNLDPGAAASVRVAVGGVPLSARFVPGLNFIRLPTEAVAGPSTHLRLEAPVPFTRHFYLGIAPADEGVIFSAGRGGKIPEVLFLEKGFRKGASDSYRDLPSEGLIRIPVYRLGGHRPVVKLEVRNKLAKSVPLSLRLGLSGTETAEISLAPTSGWQTVEYPLPAAAPEGAARLSIAVVGRDGPPLLRGISLRQVRLEQVPVLFPREPTGE